jgi:hypothetical protein
LKSAPEYRRYGARRNPGGIETDQIARVRLPFGHDVVCPADAMPFNASAPALVSHS